MSQNPYFYLFPINNARTGYKPFALPVVYIERQRQTVDGLGLANSESLSIRYYIVDAPDPAKVAGPFNSNLRIPESTLFEITLDAAERSKYLITLRYLDFYDANGNSISYENATEGDFFSYSLASNNVTTKVAYFPDAYYYDFSTISIEVEQLPKPKRYLFVWEAAFNERILTGTGSFKCIKDNVVLTQLPLEVAHPGEVHEAMFRGTPSFVYNYDGFTYATDPTLEFYRPFADILQDVYDEQDLLEGVNYIDSIPAEFIPYLAYLIGWDLPNFPGASDKLRRTILKNAARLQKIKGTKRVILELFDIFGYAVDLVNLYSNLDGTKLLAPFDGLDVIRHCQVDLIASNVKSTGFSLGVVPLTFKPIEDTSITLYAWLVNDGDTKNALLADNIALSSDLNALNDNICQLDSDGRTVPIKLLSSIPNSDSTVVGSSVTVVGLNTSNFKIPILNNINVKYDKIKNELLINYDHEMSIHAPATIFIYAVYERNEVIVPSSISNTRSNKFDVEIISKIDDEVPDFELLQFLLNFLFKLKAFHSLLRKIKITVGVVDVYNVSDFCVNGIDEFAPGSDLGDLQTHPPVTIVDESECETSGSQFKKSDITIKNAILNGLEEEFQAWKALNPDCSLTQYGQDKVLSDPNIDFDHEEDTRPTYCEPDTSKPDYCYKGRVQGDVYFEHTIKLPEIVQCNPCELRLGTGFYWETNPLTYVANTQTGGLLKHKTDKRLATALLNFTNKFYYSEVPLNQNLTLALDPISLNIEKDNLGFPGHRFISIGKLESDYTSSYRARPWDYNFVCGYDKNPLNAQVVEMTCTIENDLDIPCEDLVYDDADLVYYSNGIAPDVDSMDPSTTGLIITSKLYQNTTEPHPAITDDFTITTETSISTSSTTVFGAIYKSSCNDTDYISGYPSEYGIQTVQKDYRYVSGDTENSLDLSGIAAGIGLPTEVNRTEFEVFLNSMIFIEDKLEADYRYFLPFRLDCGCLFAECDITSGATISCNTASLYDDNGEYDPGCDKLKVEIAVVLRSVINMCGIKLNNEIESLLCLAGEDCVIPSSGDIKYKDTYGIIYESSWIISESTLDITTITKDPRIPGEEPSGYKDENGIVFRKGIITQYRKIFKIIDEKYVLESESSIEQSIGYFKDTLICGDPAFTVFGQNLDCAASDSVELPITDGPHWIDPNDLSDTGLLFTNLGCAATGVFWADVNDCGDPFVDDPYMLYWVDMISSSEPDACDTGISTCSP